MPSRMVQMGDFSNTGGNLRFSAVGRYFPKTTLLARFQAELVDELAPLLSLALFRVLTSLSYVVDLLVVLPVGMQYAMLP